MSKFVQICLKLFSSLIILLLVAGIQLRFVSFYLKNIDHLHLFNKVSNEVISIKNVELDTWANFSGFKLSLKEIYSTNQDGTLQVLDEATITIDLHSLYSYNDEPILKVHIYNLNSNLLVKTPAKATNASLSHGKKTALEKVINILNKKNIISFKLEVDFKNFFPKNSFNNMEITNFSFTNLKLSKDYIGRIEVKFKTDRDIKSISGFVMRDKIPIEDKIKGIFSKENNKNLIVELYGYLNHSFVRENKYTVEPNGFYKLLLEYNPVRKDVTFNGELRAVNVKMDGINPIPACNIEVDGNYNFTTRELFLKEFSFDLKYLDEIVPINGNLSLTKYSLDLSAAAKYSASKDLVYYFWPVKGSEAKYNLQNLIVNTKVKDPSLKLRAISSNGSHYKADALDLQFTLENTSLNKYFQKYNYSFVSDKIDFNITLHGTKLKSKVVCFENDIAIKDLNVFIPFGKKERVECNFEGYSPASSIQNILGRYIDEIGKLDGNIKFKINSLFRIIDSQFVDLSLSGLVDLNNLSTIYKDTPHKIDAKNLSLKMKQNNLRLQGDIKYNAIKIRNLTLNGEIIRGKNWKIHSADFKVDLGQPKVEELVSKIQSKAAGTLHVKSLGDRRFSLVLDDVMLTSGALGVEKQSGIAGHADFRLDNNSNLRDIKIKLPMLDMSGNIDISNNKVDSYNLKFNKLNDSAFEVRYSDNFYTIYGSEIHIEDIEKMFRGEKNSSKKKELRVGKSIHLSIKANKIYNKKQLMLEDTSLEVQFDNGQLKKLDGYAYAKNKGGYLRMYFDEPVFALIVTNLGYVINTAFNFTSLKKGSLSLYGTMFNSSSSPTFSGKLYLYNFKLLESYLLSTILKIYALSGFSVSNIFNMFNNGIKFSNMQCLVAGDKNHILFDNCQAFSNSMLLSLGSEINLRRGSGEIEGLIVPKNFFNAPIIFLQQILNKQGKTLLDGMEDKQNFSISWQKNEKPIVKTNPISFILPSIFSNIFSKKKTVKKDKCHNPNVELTDSDAST